MTEAIVISQTTMGLEEFAHVRILIGLVIGLGVTRLLNGMSKFVQHPGHLKIHPPHMAWACFMLLYLVHFWWFQFNLYAVNNWKFENYLFLITYAALMFFITSLLFPDSLEGYSGYAEYFRSRRHWFFGMVAFMFLIDMADTALKGREHFMSFGPIYPIRQTVLSVAVFSGAFVQRIRYHIYLAIAAIFAEIWWISIHFRFLA